MPTQTAFEEWYTKEQARIRDTYFTLLRFPSVSADPQRKEETQQCADWVEQQLQEIGFETEQWETSTNPVIFAEWNQAGGDAPTILIYNHYDVQPPEPLKEWTTPPFEPSERNGEVYARGAQDNKGQLAYVMEALRMQMEQHGKLPINVKLCIEGDEETGSAGLSEILYEHNGKLQADYLLVADMGLKNAHTPTITLGIRGIVTMDFILRGTNTDLHSGSHGGLAYNPLRAMVEILGGLWDTYGKVTVPGFYDEVVAMEEDVKAQLSLDFDAQGYEKTFGAPATGGEKGIAPLERAWLRPTLEINGLTGGYSGAGFKTVIPAQASAKISCRLVPDQDPRHTAEKVKAHLESRAPEGIEAEVHIHRGMGRAVRADPDSRIVKALSQAYSEVFGSKTELIYSGGSIPIITELARVSGGEVVLMGLGLDEDQIHAPNEHFGLDRLKKGVQIIARSLELLA